MKKITDFTFDEQIKIWIHYVVRICYLNAILKIEKKSPYPEHKIIQFESFVNETNELKSEGLIGYYNRFKNDIFK